MTGDRLTGPLRAIARGADPLRLYRCMYRAKLAAQSGDLGKVDVVPEDPLVPPMSGIPLRHGLPGIKAAVAPGAILLVGWDNGKPDRPFAALWSADANVISILITGGKVTVDGALVELGGKNLIPVMAGVLTGESMDPFTGLPHWMLGNASPFVMAKNKS